ncbi:MAG: glycosyltransferase [Cyclobacteriaceae bacterium]
MNRHSQNILLIIPNLDFGGAQQSFVALSNELAKNHRIINVVFNQHNMGPYTFAAPLLNLGVPASDNLLGKIINFVKRLSKVRAIKKQYAIQVSISFLEGADYVNLLTKRKDKTIISVRGSKKHDQDITGWLGWLRHRLLLPGLYRMADGIVTLNQGIRNELIAHYKLKKPIQVIYNGFNAQHIAEQISESIDQDAENLFQWPVLINHGRLSVEKGLEQFIEVMVELRKRNINCKFLILGEGTAKRALQRTIDDCQLVSWSKQSGESFNPAADVYFWGFQQNPFKYLARARLFVLPSLHEGFGNSLAEAMLCGIPVLAADCPYSPRELLAPDSTPEQTLRKAEWANFGILLPPWNTPGAVEAWAEVIADLLNSAEKHQLYGQKAKERIAWFSMDRTVQEWNNLIDEVT